MDRNRRNRLIDAGRGGASLSVLLFHSLSPYPGNALPGVLRWLKAASEWGWLGVHAFFAISGWCIAERMTQGNRTGESGIHFTVERWLRIYPTYWAALAALVTIRLAAAVVHHAEGSATVPQSWSAWLGAICLVEPYQDRGSFLVVAWSLAYEIGFYILAAVALVAARLRRGLGPALFLAGSLLCFMPWDSNQMQAPWRVLSLWPDFFAGVAGWWAASCGHRLGGYGVLALMLATNLLWPTYGGIGRGTAVGTAICLALAWRWDDQLAKLPFIRALGWIGGVSYSLYLIHVPVLSPIENLLARWIPSASPWFVVVWGGATAAALIGAVLLNRFVEKPVERWRRRAL